MQRAIKDYVVVINNTYWQGNGDTALKTLYTKLKDIKAPMNQILRDRSLDKWAGFALLKQNNFKDENECFHLVNGLYYRREIPDKDMYEFCDAATKVMKNYTDCMRKVLQLAEPYPEIAISYFGYLQTIVPNQAIIAHVIFNFVKQGDLTSAENAYDLFAKNKIKPSKESLNMIINSFGKQGNLDKMMKYMSEMQLHNYPPDVISLTGLLLNYTKTDQQDKVSEVVQLMEMFDIKPSFITYSVLIDYYSRKNQLEKVLQCEEALTKDTQSLSVSSWNSLIRSFGRVKRLDKVEKYLKAMKSRSMIDTYTVNILLGIYQYDTEMFENSLKLLNTFNLRPDNFTFSNIFMHYSTIRSSEKIEEALNMMKELNIEPNLTNLNILLVAYMRLGNTARSLELAQELEQRGPCNLETQNHILMAYCRNGDTEKAEEQYRRICSYGFTPNIGTLSNLASLYSKNEEHEKFEHVFDLAKTAEIKPDGLLYSIAIEHFLSLNDTQKVEYYLEESKKTGVDDSVHIRNCLLRNAVHSGNKAKAQQLIQDMQGKIWDQRTYGFALTFYCKNGDTENIILCLQKMIEDCHRPNTQILSVIFSSLKSMDLVERALLLLKEGTVLPPDLFANLSRTFETENRQEAIEKLRRLSC